MRKILFVCFVLLVATPFRQVSAETVRGISADLEAKGILDSAIHQRLRSRGLDLDLLMPRPQHPASYRLHARVKALRERINREYARLSPDFIVHSLPGAYNIGWVTDRHGADVIGSPSAPVTDPAGRGLRFATESMIGATVKIMQGKYGPLHFTGGQYQSHMAKVMRSNGTRRNPLIIYGELDAQGEPLAHFFSRPGDAALSLRETAEHPEDQVDNILILGLKFSGWTGIRFGASNMSTQFNQLTNITVADCVIDGLYDHRTRQYDASQIPFPAEQFGSKWGIFSGPTASLNFVFNTVKNVQWEHAAYMHLNGAGGAQMRLQDAYDTGPVLIAGNVMTQLGRTPGQFTARTSETAGNTRLAANRVPIFYALNYIVDNGLSDGCQGGGGVSIYGNHRKGAILSMNLDRTGYDDLSDGLRAAVSANCGTSVPFTGAVRSNAYENDGNNTTKIQLLDNDLRFAPGTGNRELVKLSGVDKVFAYGNILQTGADLTALRLVNSIYGPMKGYNIRDNLILNGTLRGLNNELLTQPACFGTGCRD